MIIGVRRLFSKAKRSVLFRFGYRSNTVSAIIKAGRFQFILEYFIILG